MNVFVFDIETIPDLTFGREQLGLEGLPDEEVANAMQSLQKAQSGSTFLKHHVQQIVAISGVLRTHDDLKVWSLGDEDSTEKELIERFYKGVEKYRPTLVTWNGGAFDLPVLHYRALYHGVQAPIYWDSGEIDNSTKYNNYLNRYHTRHLDLMDSLAAFQSRAFAKLDAIASLLKLPGKMGLSGQGVLDNYLKSDIKAIRDYCEIDVLNTYLIYLRFEYIRGHLASLQYQTEIERVQNYLKDSDAEHFQNFLDNWKTND